MYICLWCLRATGQDNIAAGEHSFQRRNERGSAWYINDVRTRPPASARKSRRRRRETARICHVTGERVTWHVVRTSLGVDDSIRPEARLEDANETSHNLVQRCVNAANDVHMGVDHRVDRGTWPPTLWSKGDVMYCLPLLLTGTNTYVSDL